MAHLKYGGHAGQADGGGLPRTMDAMRRICLSSPFGMVVIVARLFPGVSGNSWKKLGTPGDALGEHAARSSSRLFVMIATTSKPRCSS